MTTTVRRRAPTANIEEQHQAALINWATFAPMPELCNVEPGSKVADYLFAIPNGGGRSKAEAGRLKAQGVKAGVWDLMFPVPVHGLPGLWIEMKRPESPGREKGRVSKEQIDWGRKMTRAGYATVVCWDWESARRAIEAYLEQGLAGEMITRTWDKKK